MKYRRLFLILICIILSLLLSGCGDSDSRTLDARAVVGTDLHYYSPNLTDYGELFQQVMQAGDGKVTAYCDQITDAFLEEVRELHPDALILTGDLSFNGERKSHEDLASKLAELEKDGTPVLVLPGNHDLNRSGTYSFYGSEATEVPTVSAEEFRSIYAAFGYDEAISEDQDSLSYVAQLNETTRVMMLDANTLHDFCGFSDETLAWAKAQLADAAAANQFVLVCCHQNLFQHSMFGAGYVLNQSEKLQALLSAYNVPLFLSGHMHIQHIQEEGSITEIATSALSMGACQYGVLEAEGEEIRYGTKSVDMSAWAERHGIDSELYQNFSDYARSAMEQKTRLQAEQQLLNHNYSEDERIRMVDYACTINYAYFSGDLSEIQVLDPENETLTEWKESGTFFGVYFASIEKDIGRDYTRWTNSPCA